jgi:hypothetical protein
MTNDRETRRLYADQEISRIIKRAAQLQEQQGPGDQIGRGISIGEIEQIARDLGIDPTHVRQAASELSGSPDSASGFSLFGQALIEARRRAKGEMSERDWEMMVQEIRRALGCTGETSTLGKALEWKTSDKEIISYQVTASPREGETDIQIVSRRDGAAFLTYLVFGIVGVFSSLAIAAPFNNPVEWLAGAGVLGGVMTTARLLLGRWTRSKKREIHRLMDKLESIVAEQPQEAVPASTRAEQSAGESRQSLRAEETEVIEETSRPRARDSA